MTRPISKQHSAAARRNGKKGGRPRSISIDTDEPESEGMGAFPQAVVDRIGPAPDDPMEMIRWYARLNSELAILVMTGGITRDAANTLRAIIATATKLNPPDLQLAADQRLRNRDREQRSPTTGTKTEEVTSGEPDRAVRRSPR